MKDFIRKKLIQWLTHDLLTTVTLEDLITFDAGTGAIFIDGKLVPADELRVLKAEAKAFKDTQLYRILINTPKHHAHQMLFNKLTSMNDSFGGKMLLYAIDIQEKIVSKLL